MHERLIEALLAKNWSYSMIALRAQICEHRLRSGNLGRRESERLERMAELEANVFVDDLEDEE
jgi:hypothetical protein